MRTLQVSSFVLGYVVLGGYHAAFAQTCPAGCYSDQTPAAGHGAAPDGSGRRIINIYIDSTFGSAGSNVTAAANVAAGLWNSAKDQYGNTTGYYFQVTTNVSQADITVTEGSSSGPACANIGLTQRNMTLSPTAVGTSSANLGAIMAHEIGHSSGLDDSPSPACTNVPDIMYGYTGACQQIYSSVSTQDVALSNLNLNGGTSCTRSVNGGSGQDEQDATPDGGGGGGGEGGGGGCGECVEDDDCNGGDGEFCDGDGCCESGCDEDCELDPIIIDITGAGYQLTTLKNGVKFDFAGTGTRNLMSWTAAGWYGGFLALDRNGNGKIDNGSELFGNLTPQPAPPSGQTANGYLALAVYDQPANGGNGDGWIDDKDAIYSKLLIWVDKNHNGVSDPGELLTLKQAGILRISLSYASSPWTDAFGNKFRYRSVMTTTAAPVLPVYDVLLQGAAPAPATSASTKIQ